MTTAPESILARFATSFDATASVSRLRLTYEFGDSQDGYISQSQDGRFWLHLRTNSVPYHVYIPHITRIDYSNARYRGEQPLWEREGK